MRRGLPVLLVSAAIVLPSCHRPEPEHPWLKGDEFQRLEQVAAHLRGNDVVMWEVGYRHRQLYEAITSGNRDFARYQLEKIAVAMKLGVERRPKRKPSLDLFLRNVYPPMQEALASDGDPLSAFKTFTAGCISCHVMEKVAFVPVAQYWEQDAGDAAAENVPGR